MCNWMATLNSNMNHQMKGVRRSIKQSHTKLSQRMDIHEQSQKDALETTNKEVADLKQKFLDHQELMTAFKEREETKVSVKMTSVNSATHTTQNPSGSKFDETAFSKTTKCTR